MIYELVVLVLLIFLTYGVAIMLGAIVGRLAL